jgi:eukaryotic-like serine/threonine-protein kinase
MAFSSDERGPVELLADEFLARCKRGENPTIKEYCDGHPELADEIRDVFEAVLMVEDLKPGTADPSGSFGEAMNGTGKRLQQVGDYRILCEIGRGGMGRGLRGRAAGPGPARGPQSAAQDQRRRRVGADPLSA